MTNLLEETRIDIQSSGHTPTQVAWVGSRDGKYAISWEGFTKLANIKYDSGYGGQEVANDLVIVFNDGTWLERSEYDGSEAWTYNRMPVRQLGAKPFARVKSDDTWASIHEMNRPGGRWGDDAD
jgi:hypothetical protein